MGDQAAALLGGKGQVAIITSVGATNLQRRLEGVREVLSRHKDIEIVEVYDIKEDSGAVRGDHRVRHESVSRARRLDFGRRLACLHAQRACCGSAADESDLVRHDSPGARFAEGRKVQVLLGQKYFGWGGESVRLLSEIKAGRPPASPIVDSGVDVVTPENVDEYVKSWNALARGGK